MSSWRTMARRPAPSAVRIAISARVRTIATSSRFARLAQAMSSTKLTTSPSNARTSHTFPPVMATRGQDVRVPAVVRLRMFLLHALRDGVDLGVRLLRRDAGRQPAGDVAGGDRRGAAGRVERQRDPDIDTWHRLPISIVGSSMPITVWPTPSRSAAGR